MRDPLIPPLAAIAAGILLGRCVGFAVNEPAWAVVAFAGLAIAATRQGWRGLMWICVGWALLFTGVFVEAWHRPGPPPEIDAGSRETVILAGCVVEATVLSADRDQLTMELPP